MTSPLLEHGWVAPADPGPTRRTTIVLLGIGTALLAIWWLLPAGGASALVRMFGEDEKPVVAALRIADDGAATLDVGGRDRTEELRQELRSERSTEFFVYRSTLDLVDGADVQLSVQVPAGVDVGRAAIRDVRPHGGDSSDDASFLVTIPADLLPEPTTRDSAGNLRDVTQPVDERVAEIRADRAWYDRLVGGWWWVIPLGLGLSVGLPLLLWRRARRTAFSMRVPGAGVEPTTEPPSSIDPVGVSIIVAGASDVDERAAFAGHVLDLVERRQLRMRRTTTEARGGPGVLIGLGLADELGDESAAVSVLRSIADEDELTVALPDAPARHRAAPEDARTAWRRHVAGRERFERVVQRTHARRIEVSGACVGVIGIAAAIASFLTDGDGARSLAWLVVALAATTALVLGAWARDVHRWRIVARPRRTERAQWLAWREVIGTADGPALDQRNIPQIAAAGCPDTVVRASASKDAVGLDAVTGPTFAALRAVMGHDPA